MPKGSKELTRAREEEIIDACARLFKTMSFKEVTIKEIGKATTFTRTSIYNYFQTKEEIFLALLKREYESWIEDLTLITDGHESMSRAELADALARSLSERSVLLNLLSMNLIDIEENSRIDRLIAFKKVYGASMDAVRHCVGKFIPDMDKAETENFIYSFFPFMYGIYPYAFVTDKQREAMEKAEIHYTYQSVYEIACRGIRKLLGI
ncbi:MAG: TetR family transcriptional regulator [Eubacteriaceae bacterium]